jgi:arginine/lysine/ornithine decarboxylase
MLDAGNLYDSAIGTCYEFHIPQSLMTPGQAWNLQAVSMKLAVAMGHISAGYIYAYPPGISVIVPGEIIDEIVVEDIIRMVENKLNVIGIDMKDENIYVNVVE